MNRLLGCEKEFQLKHVHYVDLVVQWTVVNEPALTQDVVDMLWGAIRARELCYEYLKIVRDSTNFWAKDMLSRSLGHEGESLWDGLHLSSNIFSIELPELLKLNNYKYHFLEEELVVNDVVSDLILDILPLCESCHTEFKIQVKLVEGTPCYKVKTTDTDHEVENVFINHLDKVTTIYHLSDSINRAAMVKVPNLQHIYALFSLFTNSKCSASRKIKECVGKDLDIYVSCMYTCSKNVTETSKCSKRAPVEQLKDEVIYSTTSRSKRVKKDKEVESEVKGGRRRSTRNN